MDILEVLGKIGFDWRVALANLINFLIIFLILKKFAFKPIENILNNRRLKIEKGLKDAEKAKLDLIKAEEIAKEITNDAKHQANLIIAESKKKGDLVIIESNEKATEEARGIITHAHSVSEKNKIEMEKEFKRESASIVTDIVEKVLREEINQEKNYDLTKKIISNI